MLASVLLARLLGREALETLKETEHVLANARFLSFALGVSAFAAGAWACRKLSEAERRRGLKPLVGFSAFLAGLLFWVGVNLEIRDFFVVFRPSWEAGWADPRVQLGYSLFWTLYAASLVAAGLWAEKRGLRWAGFALFGLTVAKAVAVDLAALSAGRRVVAFLVLGTLLLFSSYLYHRFATRRQAQSPTGDASPPCPQESEKSGN